MKSRFPHHIAITYSTYWFPENSSSDDYEEEHGWATPNGQRDALSYEGGRVQQPTEEEIYEYYSVDMEPDSFDLEEGLEAPDKAADFLLDHAVEFSSSVFDPRGWYIGQEEQDYQSGEWTQYSYHLKGFTEEEAAMIYELWSTGRRKW